MRWLNDPGQMRLFGSNAPPSYRRGGRRKARRARRRRGRGRRRRQGFMGLLGPLAGFLGAKLLG